ncbi:MAG: type II toxin-antitoxin system RelE/ParE family toxin [Planctomycetes bacterium]|nr:type II toxin-antitoxin system RelE/ParE family toxin [Planctomycetota bacterium]
MILSFRDTDSTDLYNGDDTRAARKTLPKDLWPVVQRKLSMIATAAVLGDMRSPPSNHLEALTGDRKGQSP